MPYRIISPTNSFIQFAESSVIQSCNFEGIELCLPVFADDDIAFQFVIEADTEAEADALCMVGTPGATVGISDKCTGTARIVFSNVPERYRISPFQVLYNWGYGVTGFKTFVPIGGCFYLRVTQGANTFCSNCLQRIANDCHTSVIDYGNDEDAFGFSYSSSGPVGSGGSDEDDCTPTFVQFTNVATLEIPYTAYLKAKYGDLPTVKTWIYNNAGLLQNMSISQTFNTFPPTLLKFDFGGPASGVIKIS